MNNNRLQKKCFIAATGFHLSLIGLLLFGSAFFSREDKAEDRPPIDFVPTKAVDDLLSGGGNPNARQPAAQQLPPTPPTPPQPIVKEEPVEPPQPKPIERPQPPEVVKPQERDPDAVPDKPTTKKALPTPNLTPGKRKTDTTKKTTSDDSAAKAQAEAKAQQRLLANAIQGAKSAIRSGVSGSTEVEMPGPGGGGESYANFLDVVKKVYTDAWIVPDGSADDDSTVAASVTIARSGKVTASRITRRSGNPEIDSSVQMTLDRVRFVIAMHEKSKDSERTVTIKFNARVKKGLGN